MITILWDLKQGSPEWHEFRKHHISATDAYDLINGLSTDAIFLKKLEAGFSGSKATERGHLLEGQARQLYADLHEIEVKEAGAIINSDFPNASISPDGIVGDDGLIEIKSFEHAHHKDVIKNLDPHLICQVQFQLFISRRKWVDFIAYNPEEEVLADAYVEKRFFPDSEMFAKFALALSSQPPIAEMENAALQILDLESQLSKIPEPIQAQILDYQAKKQRIAELKSWLKFNTTGKVKEVFADGSGNKLDISIYDYHRVAVDDPAKVPVEYTTTTELPDAFLSEDGKILQRVPNTKLAGNIYKAGKSLPPGFRVSSTRSISIKFNGETL